MGNLEAKKKTCPECGRTFFPTSEWIYRISNGKHDNVYCRWNCYRAALQRKEIQQKKAHNLRVLEKARARA